jgi:N6-adenosine-specific RNA methylase IME4
VNKKYAIIYADPPWSYRDSAKAGNRGAVCKYSTLKTKDLKKLNVQSICADDAVLFMWATGPMLQDALEVMQAWGFQYKTIVFTWVKKNKKADTWFTGMGHYSRSNAEYVLLGTRGKILPRESHSIHSVVEDKIMKHSRKPAVVRERIEQLFGDLPKIELFATESVDKWDAIGYDVNGLDVRDTLGESNE